MRTATATAVVAMLLTAVPAFAGAGQSAACDRACLQNIADSYVAALVAHDPSKAPMAPNAKFTEQTKELNVGEGLWKSAVSASTAFKIPVSDPVSGQVGEILMMKAAASAFPAPAGRGAPGSDPDAPADIQLALRLKVVNKRITEAEHIIVRIGAPSQLNALKTRAPRFSRRCPRPNAIRATSCC